MTTIPEENGLRMPLAALSAMLVAVVGAALVGHSAELLGVHTAKSLDGRLDQEVEIGADHIGCEQLARELLLARGDVTLLDLRHPHDFSEWHLPGSVNVAVDELLGPKVDAVFAAKPRLVVVCRRGSEPVELPWSELRQRGNGTVRLLDGGIDEFRASVLTPPTLRPGASPNPDPTENAFYLHCASAFDSVPLDPKWAEWVRDPEVLTEPCLVGPQWLAERLGRIAILDVRERLEFDLLHVVGSVQLDVGELRTQRGEGEPKLLRPDAELAAVFGNLGIGDETPVVIVARNQTEDATLALLALLRLEHRAVALLDGGFKHWLARRLPSATEVVTPKPTVHGVGVPGDDFTIEVGEVANGVANGTLRVVDVRWIAEYQGKDPRDSKRAGHVPGARRFDFSKQQVMVAGPQWIPSKELEPAFREAAGDGPAVVMCHSGHRASSTFFAARFLLGRKDVKWFEGSWLAWAADPNLPIEKENQ